MTSDALLSERDQRILELNQQGLLAAQISKVLMSEGIELSKRSVLRHITELRQDRDNNVQVNFKYKSHKPKSEFRWHKIVQVLRREIAEYTRTRGTKPSSRTMFYQLQDLGLVKPHEDTTYSRVTVLARLEWRDSNDELMYPRLDIDCFSDDSRLTSKSLKWASSMKRRDIWGDIIPDILTRFSKGTIIIFFRVENMDTATELAPFRGVAKNLWIWIGDGTMNSSVLSSLYQYPTISIFREPSQL